MHTRKELSAEKSGRTGQTSRLPTVTPSGAIRGPLTPAAIVALQRSIGNRAVSRVLAEEIDESGPAGQRELIEAAFSSPGRPLAGPMRTDLESYYQSDFSAARIHDNPVAQRATAALGAEAMTIGTHVFLGEGAAGRKDIIGHEFGHVNENLKGVAETGNDNGAGVSVTDPGQRSERRAAADGAAFAVGAETAPSVTAQRAVGVSTQGTAATVQRTGGSSSGYGYGYGTATADRPSRRRRTRVSDLPTYIRAPRYEWAHPSAAGGARSTATLGPNSYFSRNSNANPDLPRAKRDAEDHYRRAFISGHLLNEQLGGSGQNAANLTILTSGANSRMKSFDNPIIYAVGFIRRVYEGLSELYVPIERLEYGIRVEIEPSGSRHAWSNHSPGNCISSYIRCQASIQGGTAVREYLATLQESRDPHTLRQVDGILADMETIRTYVAMANEHDLIDNER